MPEYFIGLMSGTSLDGIDAALAAFEADRFMLVASHYQAYEPDLKELLQTICYSENVNPRTLGELDARLGLKFGECANRLLAQSGITAGQVTAIGSHGQTVYHHPFGPYAFSLQIGDPNRIAAVTGITTVADFRRRDIAEGGQGAPLAPGFHRAAFQQPDENRVIVNIGGIANLTVLPKLTGGRLFGFDSGPGNTLMDGWIRRHLQRPMDAGGAWARSGRVLPELLEKMQADPYFRLAPPKSTGQEYFSVAWLERMLGGGEYAPVDVQATLIRLTADTIASSLRQHAPEAEKVLVCGGGAHNGYLLELLAAQCPCAVSSTEAAGVHPDWVEALAFAWLARQALHNQPGNLPEVTGAAKAAPLGGIYRA